MTDEHPPGPDYPMGRRKPNPHMLALGFQAAGDVIHALLDHVDDLATADLPMGGGRKVRLCSLSEVEEWLLRCEQRVRHGTVL